MISERLAGRELRVSVTRKTQLVGQAICPPGSDVLVGDEAEATVRVPGWPGPMLTIISHGRTLNLVAGMQLHMCHDDGENRAVGSYEELVNAGTNMPIQISCSKLNIAMNDEVVIYVMYLQ